MLGLPERAWTFRKSAERCGQRKVFMYISLQKFLVTVLCDSLGHVCWLCSTQEWHMVQYALDSYRPTISKTLITWWPCLPYSCCRTQAVFVDTSAKQLFGFSYLNAYFWILLGKIQPSEWNHWQWPCLDRPHSIYLVHLCMAQNSV